MTEPDYGPYEVHPLLNFFPLLEGVEFDVLVASISEHGLGRHISLSADEGTILDGRNRYLACIAARVDPVFKPVPQAWDGLAIAHFIIAENLHRRHALPPQHESALWEAAELLAKGTGLEKATHSRVTAAKEARR